MMDDNEVLISSPSFAYHQIAGLFGEINGDSIVAAIYLVDTAHIGDCMVLDESNSTVMMMMLEEAEPLDMPRGRLVVANSHLHERKPIQQQNGYRLLTELGSDLQHRFLAFVSP